MILLTMARNLTDPKTRQATAFYAAVAVAVYDVIQRGFHPINAIMLASAAGLTVAGAIAAIMQAKPPASD